MKYVKMLGLAAAAAAALMAFVGAGSASADVICATNETPCHAEKANPTGTTYTATLKEGTESKLSAGFSTIKCKESSLSLKQTDAGGTTGEPVHFELTGLSFGNCNATVNVLNLGSGQVAYTSEMNGTITGSGTEVEVLLGSTKCLYAGEITEGLTVSGGAPATASAVAVKLVRQAGSSVLCANPSKWSAEYVFGQTAWVAANTPESGTTFCKADETPCAAENANPAGTTYTASLKEGTELKFSAGFSTIKCKESSLSLEQTDAGGVEKPVLFKTTGLSYGNCNATFTVLSLGSGGIARTTEMNGTITGSGTEVEIVSGTTKCFYGGEITEGISVVGGAPMTASMVNVKFARQAGSSPLCANPSKWNAEYVFAQTAWPSGA